MKRKRLQVPALLQPKTESKPRQAGRGEMGLWPLVVFIAIVCVTTIATGILINTTGVFGLVDHSSSAAEPPTVRIVQTTGIVADGEPPTVRTVVITVEQGQQSPPIDLAETTLEWFGPTGQTVLTYGTEREPQALDAPATEFAVASVHDTDGSTPLLNAPDDRVTLEIVSATLSEGAGLRPGTTVVVKFSFPSGTTQYHTLHIPKTIGNRTAIAL